MATIPKTSTKRRWIASFSLLVWLSGCAAWATFANVHPWSKALSIWWMVPWTGIMGYICGRRDMHWEKTWEENQPWLYEELNEFLEGSAEHELLKVRTRFVFHQKERD